MKKGEEDDYRIYDYKGKALEFYGEFSLEKENTFEIQRERFAKVFIEMINELVTFGESLRERGGS